MNYNQEENIYGSGHDNKHFEKIVIINGQLVMMYARSQKCVVNPNIRHDMICIIHYKVV